MIHRRATMEPEDGTMKNPVTGSLLIVLVVAACGTSSLQKKKVQREESAKLQLRDFADQINRRVQRCASDVLEAAEEDARANNQKVNRELRRALIRWQVATLRWTQRALHYPDARWCVVEMWSGIFRVQAYLKTPEATRLIGERGVAIIAEHFRSLEQRIELRTAAVLTDSQRKALRDASQQLAASHPISDDELLHPGQGMRMTDDGGALALIAGLPSELFSIGGGVKDTAMAVYDVAKVADRGVDGIESMPQMVRWETELLLMHVEENETVMSLTANADRFADVAERIGRTVETLPAEIEKAVTRIVSKFETTQPEFRATLTEGRGAITEARGAIQDVGPVVDKVAEQGPWIEKTATSATEAGAAWEGVFRELNLLVHPPLDPDAPPPEPSPPFDMKDLASTAEYTNKAAVELRAAVADVRGIIDGDGLDQRLQQVDTTTRNTLDLTSEHATALINTITWRAAGLIVLFFALLAGYRVIVTRSAKG
jgi:hypothetical protein